MKFAYFGEGWSIDLFPQKNTIETKIANRLKMDKSASNDKFIENIQSFVNFIIRAMIIVRWF